MIGDAGQARARHRRRGRGSVGARPDSGRALRVRVGTGSVPVLLGQLQPPGKKPMNAADWARGARLADGVQAS